MTSRIVCVTGGAGFIGSHVATALLAAGHRVLIVDDLSTGCKENLPPEAEFHQLDIRSPRAARLLIEAEVEVLVHHAAQIDVRRSVADPRFDAEVNILGTVSLLESAREGSLKQVIFASTGGAIYGEQDTYPAGEDHPTRPVSPYGVAKLAVEHYLYFYHVEHGLDVTSLRYANVYGPRQSPHGEAGVVAIFLNRLLAGRQPTINGDGRQTRDYVYVDDVVGANMAVLGRPGFSIFNVGTGVETDVVQLFAGVCTALRIDCPPVHGPAKPGEQRRSCISSKRILRELGTAPKVQLADGLTRTAAWFRARVEEPA